jgi:hypothetical protein
MSPARLQGAARRCATGLRPALDPGRPIQDQAAAGARGDIRHTPGPAPVPCPTAAANICHQLTRARSTDKQGSVWVRWVLCEAAQKAKHSPQFAASYQSIAKRRGTKIATTAIARKLLTRAYHLLTDASSGGAPS